MIKRLLKFIRNFSTIRQDSFLNLPKIRFQQEKFDNFLKEKHGVKKPIKVVFGSSPLRWVFGLFQNRKNIIVLFWPGIITKALSENSRTALLFASVLAHETSYFLECQRFLGRLWLSVQYIFIMPLF